MSCVYGFRYPDKLYELAARQLVARHRILEDTIGTGHVCFISALFIAFIFGS